MSPRETDRLVLHGGAVHTMDEGRSVADAIGLSKGRVAAVGSVEEVRAALPRAEERDLHGAAVYPGFIDAHHHLCFAATYAGFPEARTPPHQTLDDIVRTVAEAAGRTPEGEWIVVVGYDESRLAERRRPTRRDLDRATTRHPVLLVHFTYHEGVLNSAGLARTDLACLRTDPPGGMLGRDPDGPDGRVYERCFGHAEAIARAGRIAVSREGWFALAREYQERVLAAGITHVCDAAVPPSMEELYREWQRRGELHLGITMMPLCENMFAAPRERLGGGTGASEGRLHVGPLKLFTDGGLACAMCISLRDAILQFARMVGRSLRQRSALPWRLAAQQQSRFTGGALHTGLLYYEPDDLERLVTEACAAGFDVGMHAAGNEAIGQALDVFARAYHGGAAPRIDHFFFADEDLLRRAAAIGCHAVVQPIQLPEIAPMLNQVGIPGALRFQAFAAMRGAGLTLAGSSDAPVFSFDVLRAIDAAVRRRLPDGSTADPDQRLGVDAAVALYTCDAARVLGLEGEIGVLRPGARADAVLLNEPLHGIDPERLHEVEVLSTFTGTHEHPR